METTIGLLIPADHPAFAGHFPGQPLLPGVVLISEVVEAILARPQWAELLGATGISSQTKFLAPVRPGDELALHLTAAAGGRGVSFEIRCGTRVAASGQLQATAASDAA